MPETITTAEDLAGYPLGAVFADRIGDVWMISYFAGTPDVRLTSPETTELPARHILKKWGPLTPQWQPLQPQRAMRRPATAGPECNRLHGQRDLGFGPETERGSILALGCPVHEGQPPATAQPLPEGLCQRQIPVIKVETIDELKPFLGKAVLDITVERLSHERRGWTAEHDRIHGVHHLVKLAERYAATPVKDQNGSSIYSRAGLVKAASLLVAAIDLLDHIEREG